MNTFFDQYAYDIGVPIRGRSDWTFCFKLGIPVNQQLTLMSLLNNDDNVFVARDMLHSMPPPLVEEDDIVALRLYFKIVNYVKFVQWSFLGEDHESINADFPVSDEVWKTLYEVWRREVEEDLIE